MLIKGFCEDVLKAIDMLDAGNCSLKGFVCHRLLDVHRRLKKMHGFVHRDEVWEDNYGPSNEFPYVPQLCHLLILCFFVVFYSKEYQSIWK